MNYRKEILDVAKKSYNRNLVAGTSGNVSMRINDNFLITPSSLSYDVMKEKDIVEIDLYGNVINSNRKPSSEWQMHIEIYNKYPNINAIVHTHSPIATAFAVNHENIPLILIEMKPFLGGDVKTAPFEKAGSRELGKVVLPFLENRKACLLANHGVIAVGNSMEEAFLVAEYVEDAAKIYYYAKTSGTPNIIKN